MVPVPLYRFVSSRQCISLHILIFRGPCGAVGVTDPSDPVLDQQHSYLDSPLQFVIFFFAVDFRQDPFIF
jgi:hypothetical protein